VFVLFCWLLDEYPAIHTPYFISRTPPPCV